MQDVVIVAYGRSPVGRARKGGLASFHPIGYSAQTLKGLIAKVPQLDPADIEDVIMGCAMPCNETAMNIARLVVNRAELPDSVCGQTINRFCSSGLQAIVTRPTNAATSGLMKTTSAHTWAWARPPSGLCTNTASLVKMDAMAVASNAKAAKAQQEGKFPSIIPH